MLRPILRYGESVLHQAASPVDVITPEIHALVDDMVETMYAAPGIGLAATQIGVPLRVIVVDLSVGEDAKQLIRLVNPEFVERDGEQHEEEGCLSVPGYGASPIRPARAASFIGGDGITGSRVSLRVSHRPVRFELRSR